MCGIFCIISKNSTPVNLDQGLVGLSSIVHRGPDNAGHFFDKKCFLGLNRLSIFDLSSSAHQPFSYENWTIVFNGAIFNYEEMRSELKGLGYRFTTDSDTEVLLKSYIQWGEQFENKLNGMWAFVIYNHKSQDFYISRDRYGIKPLYYTHTSAYILISSEIKAFYNIENWQPELKDDDLFIEANSPEQLIRNINQIQSGHYYRIVGNGSVKEKKYYHFNPFSKELTITEEEASDKFLTILKDSIRLRTKGDVPFGLALSGGMDSGSIACLLSNKSTAISAVFDEKNANELKYIQDTLKISGHDSVFVKPDAKDLLDQLKKITISQELPFGSLSLLAQNEVFRQANLSGIKIMLSGQGADELLYGYDGFIKKKLSILRSESLFKALNFGARSFINNPSLYLQYLTKKTSKGQTGDTNTSLTIQSLKEYAWHTFTCNPLSSLLHYEDRNAMAHGVESRLPFLDHRLVEFCFSLSEDYHFDASNRKKLMKNAMKDILPQSLIKRKDKMAFNTPEAKWVNANERELKEAFNQFLNASKNKNRMPTYEKADIRFIIKAITLGFWLEIFA
jgi:asparagine synthase (glutamine-hydrolysing)